MGLDEALDDEQPEAGPAPVLAAPELTEDARNGLGRYALALVAHRHRCSSFTRLDHHTDSTSAVPHPVFHEVRQDLAEFVGVEPHLRELPAGLDAEPLLRLPGGDPPGDHPPHRVGEVDDLAAHLQASGLDPGDVEQVVDQARDAVGVGVDRLQHEQLLLVGEPFPFRQQGGGETLDAGQGRAEFVGDLRDEVGAAAVGAGGGVPESDDEADEVPAGAGADVPGGDEDLAVVGQVEGTLGLADAVAVAP
ncbi:hypothetical protein BJF83_08980 [Nocardiopsis sp. CNR-923]|nr:hypothetical protein BJF83_08980 [Nocardiopsis sp. CNR-923]